MAAVSISGIRELQDVFNALPKVFQENVLYQAHRAAAKPLIEKEKLLAPEGPTGRTIDSIGVIRDKGHGRNIGNVIVGPRRSKRYRGNAAHLIEFGTKPRKTNGRGKYKVAANRGVMPATPFVQPAFDATKSQVIENISTEVGKKTVAQMKRFIKTVR